MNAMSRSSGTLNPEGLETSCTLKPLLDASVERSRWNLQRRLDPAQAGIELLADQQHAQRQEGGADRPVDEDLQAATRDQHRAAEVFLQPRSQHEAEQDRRRLEFELQQQVADHAAEQRGEDV